MTLQRPVMLAMLLVATLCALHVAAQPASSFPEKTVRIVVPFPAGGATDILARLVAERLSTAFGRPAVVENISGAAGATGTAAGAKAAPDGHTLVMGTGTSITLLPHLRSDLPYDPLRDLAAVTLIASFPNLLVVRPGIPANDVKSLIDVLRASPGKLSYASSGFGASPHLSAEWFKRLTKTEILHVPYTGSGPALPALLGGHVDMMFDTLPSVLPLVQEGKLRAIAVTSAQRVPFLPDLPTIAETLPEFDVTSWLGIMVPAGTPADIRARIAAPLATFVRDPATVKRLQELGAVAASVDTPQAFDAWIRRDYEKWRRVVKETGIRIGK
jgi:tripartite-type tricarboxylate transporter receptor subunit TctC